MADNKVNSGLLEFSEDQKVFVALDAETSEVKKAVTIDGDGVETDIQGVQPSGKKEITSTAEVNVASYATAQVVDEDLVAGNIKKDVDILGVVGSYEGGGSSDFSVVDVEMIESSNTGFFIQNMVIVDAYDDIIRPINSVDNGQTASVVLYKGKTGPCSIGAPEGYSVTNAVGTGGVSIAHTFGFVATITGAGTLTVTLEANN